MFLADTTDGGGKMLLYTLQSTGQPPTKKNGLAPNASSADVEKTWTAHKEEMAYAKGLW